MRAANPPVPVNSDDAARVASGPRRGGRSVRSPTPPRGRARRRARWAPPLEALGADDVDRIIDAAASERDRLLLRSLWATGGRISEVLALTPRDVRRDALVLPNLKNGGQPFKTVFLPAGSQDLPGALLLYARGIADHEPIFVSRKRGADGARRALGRGQAWSIVKDASRRAGVVVQALRPSRDGPAGAPAPVHPHLFRHARVRTILRHTHSLPLAQRQAGWSRLQLAYMSVGDDEARRMMGGVPR